jgi:hypothetical protein
MLPKAIILTADEPNDTDLRFAKLSRFLGVDFQLYNLKPTKPGIQQLARTTAESNSCFALTGNALTKLFCNDNHIQDLKSILFRNGNSILLYDLSPGNKLNSSIQQLTDSAVLSIGSFRNDKYTYQISKNQKPITKDFTGMAFGPINSLVDFRLYLNPQSRHGETLISIDNSPLFHMINRNSSTLFIVATKGLLNIDKEVLEIPPARQLFSRLLPHIMFLKTIFKNACWHTNQTTAALIIDDPTLKTNYGYLNYRTLLDAMNTHNFTSSIAFIPWNFKRTNKTVAKLFRNNQHKFSLCVHGCDHTRAEFAETDVSKLNNKIKLATDRMNAHRRMTGISYSKAMVFPQGIFTKTAMKALKANNYSAAINSTPYPNNPSPSLLKISDFLEPAIMSHANFPLLIRRYPKDLIDFVFDAFIGRPIFIVEHHSDFRRGYGDLIRIVNEINSISSEIKWTTIDEIIKNLYLQKSDKNGSIYCRLFTNAVVIKNSFGQERIYEIFKSENRNVEIEQIYVNKQIWPYYMNNDILHLTIKIPPQSSVNIQILYKEPKFNSNVRTSLYELIRVATRRYLSDIRANYICKSRRLLSLIERTSRFISSKLQ